MNEKEVVELFNKLSQLPADEQHKRCSKLNNVQQINLMIILLRNFLKPLAAKGFRRQSINAAMTALLAEEDL